jgi:hypothetical protein
MGRTSPEIELSYGANATVNGGAATTEHPRMYYPSDTFIVSKTNQITVPSCDSWLPRIEQPYLESWDAIPY